MDTGTGTATDLSAGLLAARFRGYAGECVEKANGADSIDDKKLHLNIALAWMRLARQSEEIGAMRAGAADAAPLPAAAERPLA